MVARDVRVLVTATIVGGLSLLTVHSRAMVGLIPPEGGSAASGIGFFAKSRAISSGDGLYSKATCSALLEPGAEDHWYFLSYRQDTKGTHEVRVPFFSHAWFAQALQTCAEKGWGPHGLLEGQGFTVQAVIFGYVPSSENQYVFGERVVRLSFPKFQDLGGDLAIRLVVNRDGEVLGKQLLFSSNAELGKLALDHLESGLQIAKTGRGSGDFVDILSLTFEKGELAAFIQTHYSTPKE